MRLSPVLQHLLVFISVLCLSRAQTSTTEWTTYTTSDSPGTTTETTTEATTETTSNTTTTEFTTDTTTDTTTTEPTTDPTTDTTTTEPTTDPTSDSPSTESTTDPTSDLPSTESTTDTTTDTPTTESTTDTTTDTPTTESTTDTTTDTTTETTTEATTSAIATTPWTAPAIFYPFGSTVETGGDTFVNVIFSTPFTFFGREYTSVYVNNNGLLTFKNALPDLYPPYSFPTHGSEDYIAALWTELDDIGLGQYSYQEYTSGSVLDRATRDINQYFPYIGFTASWVFVVTWDYVQTSDYIVFYDHSAPALTFQAVLISGGNFSFLLMNYGDCTVTSYIVEAGYDTVGSTDYYVINHSPPELQSESNVNVPGRWAFLVNNGTENILGVQLKVQSFLDLTQSGNIDLVLQQFKEVLNGSDGASMPFGLKLRKIQKI